MAIYIFHSYRKLAKNNDPSRFSSNLSYEHFDSGVRMGNGAFNLVLEIIIFLKNFIMYRLCLDDC